MKAILLLFVVVFFGGCVVVPAENEDYVAECEISSDRKTLRVMNVAKETDTYYSVEGIAATPILYPTTAIVSGIYVAINNSYNVGEEKLVCK